MRLSSRELIGLGRDMRAKGEANSGHEHESEEKPDIGLHGGQPRQRATAKPKASIRVFDFNQRSLTASGNDNSGGEVPIGTDYPRPCLAGRCCSTSNSSDEA
jgi:hypothetical protein